MTMSAVVTDPLNVDDIECVSSEMFEVLRTRPLLGRTFGPSEDHPGASAKTTHCG
jgi:hypothetical protein